MRSSYTDTEETILLGEQVTQAELPRSTTDEIKKFAAFTVKHAPYFVLDSFRIYCITQVLMQRLTYQVLNELKDNYGIALPANLKTSASFNAMLLFGPAALITLFCKIRNIYKKHQSGGGNDFYERVERGKYVATEASVFALLSGSQGLMLCDLMSSIVKGVDDSAIKLPFWAFCLTALTGFISLAALFCKLVFPDTSDRLILGRFSELSAPIYPHVSRGERVLNALGGLSAVSAVSALLWEVNREINNETVQLGAPEIAILATVSVASVVMGAVATTDFPKLFHLFVMASKCIYGGAMAAAAFSGHAYFMLDNPADSAKLPFYMTGFVAFSAMIGVFNALITHYRFQEVHKANLWMLITLGRLACCSSCKEGVVDLVDVASTTRVSLQGFHPNDRNRESLATTNRGSYAVRRYSLMVGGGDSRSRCETLEEGDASPRRTLGDEGDAELLSQQNPPV